MISHFSRSKAELSIVRHFNAITRTKPEYEMYTNVRLRDSKDDFDMSFFTSFDVSMNNKKLVERLSKFAEENDVYYFQEYVDSFDVMKNIEFDFICTANDKPFFFLECQGPHHYDVSIYTFEASFHAVISDFIKEEYCKYINCPFYEIKLENGFLTRDGLTMLEQCIH